MLYEVYPMSRGILNLDGSGIVNNEDIVIGMHSVPLYDERGNIASVEQNERRIRDRLQIVNTAEDFFHKGDGREQSVDSFGGLDGLQTDCIFYSCLHDCVFEWLQGSGGRVGNEHNRQVGDNQL